VMPVIFESGCAGGQRRQVRGSHCLEYDGAQETSRLLDVLMCASPQPSPQHWFLTW
jgi:hypothetical protein